jgi:Spy/CpxP family protein refolding chaperone
MWCKCSGVHPKGQIAQIRRAHRAAAPANEASGLGDRSMMKNSALLMLTFAMLAFCPLGRAQDQEPNIDSTIAVVRANMRAGRTTLITAGMNFTDKDGAAFWPIYQQYEYERSRLDDRRAAVIKQYTQKYPNLTDAEAKAMAEQMLDCESRLAELKKKYYKKFNKVLPALTVTKFFQLERRMDLMMDMQVEAALPPLTEAQYTAPGSSVTEPPQQ